MAVTVEQLQRFSLFVGVFGQDLSLLAADCEAPIAYQKGETVYTASSFRKAIGLILTGAVTVTAENGAVMNRLSAGEMFGAAALFGAQETYVTQITATANSHIVFISQEQMTAWLHRYPKVAENYICFLSGRIRFLNHKLSVLTAGSAEGRLYQYLLTHRGEDGAVTLPHSMVELAGLLGIGRSSLYRARETLITAGFLRQVGKIYYLTEQGKLT